MKKTKVLLAIVIAVFVSFNISMNFSGENNSNLSLGNINECAFAAQENIFPNATRMYFGCTNCNNMNVPGCFYLPEDTSETCIVGSCSNCGAAGVCLY